MSTKLGFYKAVQGCFTEERINSIKERLVKNYNMELVEVDFRKAVLIDGKVYVGDICLNQFDVYFWHDTIWPSLTGADSYYINLLRAIESDTLVINSASSTEVTNDKLRAHSRLRAHGLPVSQFALVNSDDKAGVERAFDELGGRVLIKPRFGGWGSGIVRCQSIDDLFGSIELSVSMSGRHQQFLLERYYDNSPNQWTSISMIGQRPVLAYRKPLSIGGSSWKVYDPGKKDGRGLQSERVQPSGELVEIAQRAQRALGKDIVGFDFIATDEGYIIVDENGRPGLYEHLLEDAGIDIVDSIVELIVSKARQQ